MASVGGFGDIRDADDEIRGQFETDAVRTQYSASTSLWKLAPRVRHGQSRGDINR